jgi:FAD/FMN-containing dehydrogenase
MTDLRITTTSGTDTFLEEAAVERLNANLHGPLLRPGAAAYDEARKVWNGMIDRRPALIACCAGVADVIAAVKFVRTHQVLVSVRGGGHNAPGNAVCQGGLMIDLAGMRSVRVDPIRRTARAEGGSTWGDFDRETQAFGLATTGGSVSDTGIAGLTLGGGLGWLAGKHGLSCDNLLSVDLVNADGTVLIASATENADLFWGVRGGGGNFGVVTSFEYQLHPVGPVLAGLVLYPFSKAQEALTLYRDFATSIPDEVNTIGGLLASPEGDPVAAIAVCYNGSLEAGEKVLRPLRTFGPPLADHISPMPYRQVQTLLDAATVRGRRYYMKSNMMQGISDGAIDTLVERFATIPSPHSFVFFQQLGNAANRVDATATAFSHRGALCEWGCLSSWLEPAADDVNIRWTRELSEMMRPFTTGSDYVNQIGLETDEGSERIKAAFGVNYDRLVAVKNKFDPTNLFRHNQNIRPTV